MHLPSLSNEALHIGLQSTCADQRRGMAEILRYLIEVDRRSLYATMGYRSLFAYCLKALKMSENEAGPRVAVARLAKEYSWVLEALAEGDIHLTGLFRLSAHMQPSNCLDLLGEARGKTVKEIDDLLANHFPKPDVPEVLRALPVRAPVSTPPVSAEPPKKSSAAERTILMFDVQVWGSSSESTPASSTSSAAHATPAASAVAAPAMHVGSAPHASVESAPALQPTPSTPSTWSMPSMPSTSSALSSQPTQSQASPSERSTGTRRERPEKLTPLSKNRHALQLTISTDIRRKLERARDLMSHRNRHGSFESIVGAALSALLEKLERERLGKTKRPRRPQTASSSSSSASPTASASSSSPVASGLSASSTSAAKDASTVASSNVPPQRDSRMPPPSRSTTENKRRSSALPRAVRREVFARDGEQCSFVSEAGVRCDARSFLEIDHVHPKALGGEDTTTNTRILCATHNRLAAERVFGRDCIHRKIRESRAARRHKQARRE